MQFDSKIDQKLIDLIRQTEPKRLVDAILSVQPMPTNIRWDEVGQALDAMRAASGHRCCMDPHHNPEGDRGGI